LTDPSTLDATGDLVAVPAGELRISGGAAHLTITESSRPGQLYHAHFRGFDSALTDTTIDLPTPLGGIEIRIEGPLRNVRVRRPSGVPVGVSIGGGANRIHIDGQELGAIGPGFRAPAPISANHYTLVIAKAADALTVTQ
jgi:hypothetical protein